jgi:hypothetical protein
VDLGDIEGYSPLIHGPPRTDPGAARLSDRRAGVRGHRLIWENSLRTTIRRALAGLAATTAAITMATTLGATPALATDDSACTIGLLGFYDYCAGVASFEDYGEVFTLEDRYADGAGVLVQWYKNDVRQADLYWGGGAGTSKTFNRSAAEGTEIDFRVCVIDDGYLMTSTCSWGSGVA